MGHPRPGYRSRSITGPTAVDRRRWFGRDWCNGRGIRPDRGAPRPAVLAPRPARSSTTQHDLTPPLCRYGRSGARGSSIYLGREPDDATSIPDGAADDKLRPATDRSVRSVWKVALSNALGLMNTEVAPGRPGKAPKRSIVEILTAASVRKALRSAKRDPCRCLGPNSTRFCRNGTKSSFLESSPRALQATTCGGRSPRCHGEDEGRGCDAETTPETVPTRRTRRRSLQEEEEEVTRLSDCQKQQTRTGTADSKLRRGGEGAVTTVGNDDNERQ
ncbi:hypothetical protein THAOC_06045 [Thalassiosira oceanica]|uniref:Uncharacterized protein n=1 Tax=Thalassiosira oceanica TaxID=159749 RepID=K0TFP9_THAOC|nr:hypothetical protein THAOC_06045 [Thalassiosira oceanica]|eukprot:EJK72426.1 hypothetical protein THAOC_06045 [Thalassiosira oceanica]